MNMALLPLTLSVRCRHTLANAGIVTIADLVAIDPQSLLAVRNFTFRCLDELVENRLIDDSRGGLMRTFEV